MHVKKTQLTLFLYLFCDILWIAICALFLLKIRFQIMTLSSKLKFPAVNLIYRWWFCWNIFLFSEHLQRISGHYLSIPCGCSRNFVTRIKFAKNKILGIFINTSLSIPNGSLETCLRWQPQGIAMSLSLD